VLDLSEPDDRQWTVTFDMTVCNTCNDTSYVSWIAPKQVVDTVTPLDVAILLSSVQVSLFELIDAHGNRFTEFCSLPCAYTDDVFDFTAPVFSFEPGIPQTIGLKSQLKALHYSGLESGHWDRWHPMDYGTQLSGALSWPRLRPAPTGDFAGSCH